MNAYFYYLFAYINFNFKIMKPLIQLLIVLGLFIYSIQVTCNSNEAFNTLAGKCENCTYGYNSDSQSCFLCEQGKIYDYLNNICVSCTEAGYGANYAPSKDRTRCIRCECDGCSLDTNTNECNSINGRVYDKLVTGYYSEEYLFPWYY